ncbi:hypothetical protein FisN_12Lh155 [Fistulifera solaris]|uniref:Ubiquinol-cytochrome c reductase core subunit 2 n=1 Tax=Fistulifera solaris TaxID=1519565 RepID=A0A1Z5JMC9_FISSO|nr:hypothetical protein FisN_12Lh155 [Fistulifera solaris]|eukprot:GAX15144.1 hypothetical protein FisN_12Lh155 [Fistulifera solaris]
MQRVLSAAPRRVLAGKKRFSALVSLDYEYPGLPAATPQPAKATSVSVSTLPNGLTVATEDSCVNSTVIMTYPKAGSAGESLDEQGAALMNKCMNFKSGSGLSSILINRTIEDAGGLPFTTLNRAGASLGFTVAPELAAGLVPLLATDCTFEKWDVRDALALANTEAEVAGTSAQIVLTENVFAAAYGPQSPAGRPLYSAPPSLDAIRSFRRRAYGLKDAVLTVTGVKDHAAFCAEVESYLADSPVGAGSLPSMAYIGGESRIATQGSGYAHVAIAFPAPVSSAVATVVKHYFSVVGGPSGVSGFTADGLVGLYAGSASAGAVTDAMVKVATTPVSADTLQRAKSLAKGEALLALESGSKALASAISASVLSGQGFGGPKDIVSAYDAVSEAHVKQALAAMLKSNPSLAAVGDIASVPYHATLRANFA